MKKLFKLLILVAMFLVLPLTASALLPLQVNQGGSGLNTVPAGNVLFGNVVAPLGNTSDFNYTPSSFLVQSQPVTAQTASQTISNNLFGFGIPGIFTGYKTADGSQGLLVADLTAAGGALNTTLVGFFNPGGTDSVQTSYSYDATGTPYGQINNSVKVGADEFDMNITPTGFSTQYNGGSILKYPIVDGTNGQAMTTDGSGNLHWATVGGGGSPAGTTNDVQFNIAGAFAADTGNFTYDTSTTTLGVKSEGADGYSSKPVFTGSGTSTVLVNNPSSYTLPVGIAQDTFTVTVSQNNMQVLHFATGTALVGDNLVGVMSGATGQVFQVIGGNDYFVQLTGSHTPFDTFEPVTGNTGGGATTSGNGNAGDSYNWSDTQGNSGSNIVMNGGFQNLVYGVQFSSDAFNLGHVIGDKWVWNTFRSYNGIIDNGLQYNINGNFFAGENVNTRNISIGYKTANLVDLAGGGVGNIFMGHGAGESTVGASNNIAIGLEAGNSITDGSSNTVLGAFAGNSIVGGSENIVIGHNADINGGSRNNIIIGGIGTTGIGGEVLIGDFIHGNQTAGIKTFYAGDWSGTGHGTYLEVNDSLENITLNGSVVNKVQYAIPMTGNTVTSDSSTQMILDPAGALATLTIVLPASPVNGQQFNVTSTQTITGITYTGGTVVGNPAGLAPGSPDRFVYSSNATEWIAN